jgi:expansin (peptidoglycan-binding protein)
VFQVNSKVEVFLIMLPVSQSMLYRVIQSFSTRWYAVLRVRRKTGNWSTVNRLGTVVSVTKLDRFPSQNYKSSQKGVRRLKSVTKFRIYFFRCK